MKLSESERLNIRQGTSATSDARDVLQMPFSKNNKAHYQKAIGLAE
jgi:hypothetical protein